MENLNADKKVLVTGASGGIGRAIAVEAAKAGYYVICHYNGSQGKAEETLAQIKAAGGDGELIQFDVSNREDCKAKLGELSAKHGVLWGIVNNAGVTRDNTFVAMSGDDWDKVIHTNLDSFYNVINPLLMPMASRKNKRGGRIISISSVSGVYGNRGQANYSASKAGIIGFTKSLAKEYGKKNLRANAIAPGYIETSMTEVLSDEVKDAIKKEIVLGRLGKPEDVADLALFLASDMSSYITGEVIKVDGGMYV
jgi:3-oxoacyl-[acyl-carrier protein] reductase